MINFVSVLSDVITIVIGAITLSSYIANAKKEAH